MNKETLRNSMKQKRTLEPARSILEKSKRIEQLLIKQKEYHQSSTILYYVSYDNEVRTHDLIKQALKGGKTVLVPISDTKSRTLKAAHITSWTDLAAGAYDILEPRKEIQNLVPLETIELILVPGIAFDVKGNRLGHGKGYYDWLLTKLPTAYSIGLAFSFQMVKEIPVEVNDKTVQTIITENQVIDCLGDKFS
jgi:5-formyltetrahydrofolate cyclo-ligase